MTGMRGYPSDKQYMKSVSEAGKERDQEKMSAEGSKAASQYDKKRISSQSSSKSNAKHKAARKKIAAKR